MKKPIILLSILYITLAQNTLAQQEVKEKLEKHVYTLAADSLNGRQAGSIYAMITSDYIAHQFSEAGVEPFFPDDYFQPFLLPKLVNNGKSTYRNVVGIIRGNDSILKDEFIVVGAHFDHLGYEIKNGTKIVYNGADDNASGVATLIELARALKQQQSQLKRSIVVVAFDAEELGLYGSQYFAYSRILPIQNIKLMLSIDMVGWYKALGKIIYEGTGTIDNGAAILTLTLCLKVYR